MNLVELFKLLAAWRKLRRQFKESNMSSLANLNFFRTILTWLAIIIMPLSMVLGCNTLPSGTVDCAASWLGPQYAAIASSVLLILNQILKAAQGGTFGTGLIVPTVPVVSEKQKGTVTPAQVNSGPEAGGKKS